MDIPPTSAPPADLPPPSHSTPSQPATSDLKRKRSPSDGIHASASHSGPPPAKRTTNTLQINYLARQFEDDLPLVSTDDTMPAILHLLGEYQGVLDRHESMGGNLGARPLGPILIKRFERLFDGPPRVIKAHGKDGGAAGVTWLDVVEFARNKPEQFTLGQMSEGVRVCQFYTKQCRVQVSEEDWVLINSGIPQKMIPPQPIMEDEEKELGTLEILEKSLASIFHLADQVAARSRQLNHKLKGRKQAILDRRATSPSVSIRSSSPSALAYLNGIASTSTALTTTGPSGFTAVNATPHPSSSTNGDKPHQASGASSATTRAELLSKFHTLADRRASSGSVNGDLRFNTPRASTGGALNSPGYPTANFTSAPTHSQAHPSGTIYAHSPNFPPPRAPDSATATPTAPRPARLRQPPNDDDAQPYRAPMVAKMEALAKGDRVIPPCDRCRRLHMDCIKNLTACLGCTRKHAKCSWWEVKAGEMDNDNDGDDGLAVSGAGVQPQSQSRGGSAGETGGDGPAVDQLAEAAYAAREHQQPPQHHLPTNPADDPAASVAPPTDDGAAALSTLGQLGMGALERYAAAGELEMQPVHVESHGVAIGADEGREGVDGIQDERRGFGEVEMRDVRDGGEEIGKVDV